MIHVERKKEPRDFNKLVRMPGRAFLKTCKNPSGDDWKRARYWNRCSDDLYTLYGGICAYTGQWFSQSIATVSVDHFLPKSQYPQKAYEWSNYRLTYALMNSLKGDKITLDPFEIQNGDIVLDLPSCLVKPKKEASREFKRLAWFTINTLKLNDETQVQQRFEVIMNYASGFVTKEFLEKKYPFIAEELERQNAYGRVKRMFGNGD